MKANLPHAFFIYASNFTLESMIKEVSKCAFELFNNPDKKLGRFGRWESYTVDIGKHKFKGKTLLAQTWLIDMIYALICYRKYGSQEITHDEAIHLIALYNDFSNELDGMRVRKSSDAFLNLYGFFGEQKRFQNIPELFEEFAREKYILDVISKKNHPKNIYGINVEQDIIEATGFTSDDYSSLLYLVFAYFSNHSPIARKANISVKFDNPVLSLTNFIRTMDKISITLEDVRNSSYKRQVLYTKPLIKIGDEYISSNPFLILCLFINSNYWVMRDLYKSKKKDGLSFVNAFGLYFEMYVEEILNNCISAFYFKKISENKREKRADWYINVDGMEFLVEQKSGLSLLGIKQNQTDIEMMKKHILKNWGEAVEQLDSTQKALKLEDPIKIILVYEDYYKSECLDELFKLNNILKNDGKYWLVSIREFEMLLMTCKENLDLFKKIVLEKDHSETTFSKSGRELTRFLENNEIKTNKYLKNYKIMERYETVKKLCK